MAHESFEDAETAAILNKHFISVKVDREERPDIDSVYMTVCQAFTGSGGWPTSIFLTPNQKPFFAGTYFPVVSRYGMIGFRDLLRAIAARWEEDRAELLRSSDDIIRRLKHTAAKAQGDSRTLPDDAFRLFSDSFDEKNGGFGSAPKFPAPHNLLFLLAYSQMENSRRALSMVETTLIQMRKGGIFDQIGFGFSRYSTDRFFLAPHFEKMLYDNALLMLAYTAAYAVTRKAVFLDTAEKTAAYILREMTSPEGGFYSAQDADSGGTEGKYYLFGYDEILSVLGKEAGTEFASYYGITRKGNFGGSNIPNRLHTDQTEPDHAFDHVLPVLYDYRRSREKLALDDKILTAWNALMIAAFALLYRVTGKACYLTAARSADRFIEENLTDGGRLFVSWRNGERRTDGLLDDYAFYAAAQIMLFEATAERAYLRKAESLCREAMDQFADKENGGYTLSGRYNETPVSYTHLDVYKRQAKITPAYNLPSRYVLHTVGPIIHGRLTKKDKELLAACYRSYLELAEQNNLKSIAFCCISTGEFHFPNDKAAQIAVETVTQYKKQTHSEIEVIFNVFKELDYNIYRELLRADKQTEK